ncbi:hypothetical protein TrRE_jg11378, partial [Triparma retinervis]
MNVGSVVTFSPTIQRDGKSKALDVNITPDLQTVFTLNTLPGRILQDRRHRNSLLVSVLTSPLFDSPLETSPTVLPYSSPHPIPLILPPSTPPPPNNSIVLFKPNFSIVTGQLTATIEEVVIDAAEHEREIMEKEAAEIGEEKEWWGK